MKNWFYEHQRDSKASHHKGGLLEFLVFRVWTKFSLRLLSCSLNATASNFQSLGSFEARQLAIPLSVARKKFFAPNVTLTSRQSLKHQLS